MSITTQFNKFIKVFKIEKNTIKYLSTITVVDPEINIDIISPQNSVLKCLDGKVEEGNLIIYYDSYFEIPLIVETVSKLETTNIEITARAYIDMFNLEVPSQNAGMLNYKESTEKIANVNTFLNNNINNKLFYFPLLNSYYKFEGVTTTVYKWFGSERKVFERDILEAVLKLNNRKINIGLKQKNSNVDEVKSSDYYLAVEIQNRAENIETIRCDDSSLVSNYRLVHSNVEYNCLIIGMLQSSNKIFYMNKDGSILYEHDPMVPLPSNWLSDASLPLRIKQIWIEQLNDDVSMYNEALNELTGQYLNHEITMSLSLDSQKITLKNISDIIYKKIMLIDLEADVINRGTYITALKYQGKSNIDITLGYARKGFIKKLTKVMKGKK